MFESLWAARLAIKSSVRVFVSDTKTMGVITIHSTARASNGILLYLSSQLVSAKLGSSIFYIYDLKMNFKTILVLLFVSTFTVYNNRVSANTLERHEC